MTARSTSALTGICYLITHVTSVTAAVLYGGSGFDPNAPLAGRLSVLTAGLLEIILAVAVVGTGVGLLALLRTRAPGAAAGYLALRVLEASVILAGVLVLLPVVAAPGTASAPGLEPGIAQALHLMHDWSFLIGPGLVVPVHTVLLAWVLLRQRLVPRAIALLGLVGGPLVAAMNVAVLFGLTTVIPVAVVPIFAWEISLAVFLIVRGLPEARTADERALQLTGR